MKSSILLLLVFTCGSAFGQQTISELTSTSKEATSELKYIYDLDIFSYYNLKDYDTDLKKSVFLKSEEGQNKLNELKGIKAEMLKSTYYCEKEWNAGKAGNYDIKRKGFDILYQCFISNDSPGENIQTPKSVALKGEEEKPVWIVFKALPSKRVTNGCQSIWGICDAEMLFLPMTEESGLEIENDPTNTKLYYFFTPSGKEKTVFKIRGKQPFTEAQLRLMAQGVFGFQRDMQDFTITNNDLKADKVRIVVANSSSGKILYDKSFSYQVPATK